MRILVIEDETRMLELLRKGLYEHDFAVMTAADGETGLEIATAHEFDAIVLDVGLPRMDGYGMMQALRARGRATPVLMLTARDKEDDIIRGLDLGARLQSITRRPRDKVDATIEVGEVVVDLHRHKVTRNLKSIDLTRLEFLLMASLVRRAGQCVPRQTLMDSVWGPDHAMGASTLDVLVNSLRAKFDAPYSKKLIGTVRGSGYIFHDDAAREGSVTQ
jgi:DNA-binding response OmpR family regulator